MVMVRLGHESSKLLTDINYFKIDLILAVAFLLSAIYINDCSTC